MTPFELKRHREKLKLSQKAMAEKLDLCERYIVYREAGTYPITQWFARAVRDLVNHPKTPA